MGLGEPKRRVKYSIDPNALSWANSETKFGKKLMEKMGWEEGKGLGAKENGITENIKVKFKGDTKGVGFNNNDYDNVWLDHQDEFESLLSNLTQNFSKDAPSKTETSTEAVLSLEMKSKESKARLHYKKFTRSKDLTNATTTDLDCILGKAKRVKLAAMKEEGENTNISTEDDQDEPRASFKLNDSDKSKNKTETIITGLQFNTNKLSLSEYFASKMAAKNNKNNQENGNSSPQDQETPEETQSDDVDESSKKKKKKSKKKKHEKEEEEAAEETNPVEQVIEEVQEADEEAVEEEPPKKKKKSKKSKSKDEESETTQVKEAKSATKIVADAFNGSNLTEIYGYSGYNISYGVEQALNEKAQKTAKKRKDVEKKLAENPDFYEMNKKAFC